MQQQRNTVNIHLLANCRVWNYTQSKCKVCE